jgi:hypothetical protein
MFVASKSAGRILTTRLVMMTVQQPSTKQGIPAVAIRSLSMYDTLGSHKLANPPLDPDYIFDEIDTRGDGVITREEFKAALSKLRYNELLAIHEAAKANLEAIHRKMKHLEEIEKDMDELKTLTKQKQDAYNNIGMTTAADLDALFDQSKMKRKNIKSSLSGMKDSLEKARDSYQNAIDAYNNIGMTTAADIDELFDESHTKKKKAA